MSVRLAFVLAAALLGACSGGPGAQGPLDPPVPPPPAPPPPPPPPPAPPPTYDVDLLGVPRFASHDYLDPSTIEAISRFRSAAGHSYSDGFESCRSMKHYFRPRSSADWSAIPIHAPVAGTVVLLRPEFLGTQIVIRSDVQPAFRFILFHVAQAAGVDSGGTVTAGQVLGHHVGNQTFTDIAVEVDTPAGLKLVSWFEVMADQVFGAYAARGIPTRATMVIARAERDADPLTCDGEAFTGTGTLSSWVALP